MTSVLQRLRKRRAYPVAIGEDTIHVRALTLGEGETLDRFEGAEKVAFAFGCALVNDAGEPEFPRLPNEGNEAFAKRLVPEFADIPQDVLNAISKGIEKVSTPPNGEALKKSS